MLCFVFAVSLCVCLSVCAVCLGGVRACVRACVHAFKFVSCLRLFARWNVCAFVFLFFFFFFLSEFCEVVAGVYSNENACISFSPLFSH